MCGIVGYVGKGDARELLVKGLKRLEYRGYDSCGLAINTDNRINLFKRQGKVSNLAEVFTEEAIPPGKLGIAHTRWATHGIPNQANAHPHLDCTGTLALVHNGIIENAGVLKQELEAEGHHFASDTDTEVLVHLVEKFLKDGDVRSALVSTLRKVVGTYGIGLISSLDPDTLYGARMGSPLILGVGDGEMFLASDACALVAHTNQVVYLEDGELVSVTADNYQTFNLEGSPVGKDIHIIDYDTAKIEKRGFPHFMLKEIFEQPETVTNAYRGRLYLDEATSKLGGLALSPEELQAIDRIVIIACGTSWHAGLVGEYLLEDLAGIPTEVDYASEFRYRNSPLEPNTLVIAISQSGETADTLAGVREARRKGARIMGICNVVGSSIARECGRGVYIHAGPEIGVASTKAFTSQLTVLTLLALYLGRMKKLSYEFGKKMIEALINIPSQIGEVFEQADEVKRIASLYADKENFLYIGRHYQFPVALEGALKLKEISYVHAEGQPAAEMKHGPIALIDQNTPTVALATNTSLNDKTASNIQEIKARRGPVIVVTNKGDSEMASLGDEVIFIPKTIEELSPLLTVIPLQLLAYHIAVQRGCDVDQPRNLAKSVTVE